MYSLLKVLHCAFFHNDESKFDSVTLIELVLEVSEVKGERVGATEKLRK